MALSSGIYTLIGVFAGGLVTGGVQYASAKRNDLLDARVARRRIRRELRDVQIAIAFLIDGTDNLDGDDVAANVLSRIGPMRSELRRAAMMEKHGDMLARHLSDDAWEAVERAYLFADALAGSQSTHDLADAHKKVADAIETAIARLA